MLYLVTGGAGFIGANLSISLKLKHPAAQIYAMDNLKRRGSELNLDRLKRHGIGFVHGDIRNPEDFLQLKPADVIIECSAEPSVLAGCYSPDFLVKTNLLGTINCLNFAKEHGSDFIFLSTSRVYPIKTINSLNVYETETRFELADKQSLPGADVSGINETFPLDGLRSLYGATKLASELLIQEYSELYGFNSVINRCGVITGPWQFGKVDQGVVSLWIANHIFNKPLTYIGFGGNGKQVRDILHIDDLFELIDSQINNMDAINQEVFNIGGGREVSVSLLELTSLCQEFTGNRPRIAHSRDNRVSDIKIYLTNTGKAQKILCWRPKRSVQNVVEDIVNWICHRKTQLENILG